LCGYALPHLQRRRQAGQAGVGWPRVKTRKNDRWCLTVRWHGGGITLVLECAAVLCRACPVKGRAGAPKLQGRGGLRKTKGKHPEDTLRAIKRWSRSMWLENSHSEFRSSKGMSPWRKS
jgi:hypothetical protein